MTLIKKYWFRALLFLLWVFLVTCFGPRQKQYYLDYDLKGFEENAHKLLILFELILLCIIPILFRREMKGIKQFLQGLFFLAFSLALFYLSFYDLFANFGLFINRQVSRNDHPRSFVVSAMVTDKGYDDEHDLYDIRRKELITRGKLVDQLRLLKFNVMDTVQVDFKRGLFDVDYYEDPKIYKK